MTAKRRPSAAALAPRMTNVARRRLVPRSTASWNGSGAVIARLHSTRTCAIDRRSRSSLLAARALVVARRRGGLSPFVEGSGRDEQPDHQLAVTVHLAQHARALEA